MPTGKRSYYEKGQEPTFGTESKVPAPRKHKAVEGNEDNKLRGAEEQMDREIAKSTE